MNESINYWRLVGEFSKGRTPEELRAQKIGDWPIWAAPWSVESAIVIPDSFDPSKKRHIGRYSANHHGSLIQFARDMRDDGTTLIYFPASHGDEGSVGAADPKHEGYWRTRIDEESELPWPTSDAVSDGRVEFLRALEVIEEQAERVQYRGFSFCRICKIGNGSLTFRLQEWDWPKGFRHYVAERKIRPTAEFETFVLNQSPLPK